jgi:hypothetical protein
MMAVLVLVVVCDVCGEVAAFFFVDPARSGPA